VTQPPLLPVTPLLLPAAAQQPCRHCLAAAAMRVQPSLPLLMLMLVVLLVAWQRSLLLAGRLTVHCVARHRSWLACCSR
jgi:hypothetical protein